MDTGAAVEAMTTTRVLIKGGDDTNWVAEGGDQFEMMLVGTIRRVFLELGSGLSEVLYRNALAYALRKEGWTVGAEVCVPVRYDQTIIGMIRADLVIYDQTSLRILELKVAAKITDAHCAQCQAYVARSEANARGYIVNFGASGGIDCVALV